MSVDGVKKWLVPGLVQFQPYEMAKICSGSLPSGNACKCTNCSVSLLIKFVEKFVDTDLLHFLDGCSPVIDVW